MHYRSFAYSFLLLMVISATTVKAEDQPVFTFAIVPEQSSIRFTATQNNSPVTGRFEKFSGDIQFDPNYLEESSASITIDMSSIGADYQEVSSNLKQESWFNSEKFLEATFVTERFTHTGDKNYIAHGKLTLRGVTKPLAVAFTLDRFDDEGATITGNATIKRTDFGVGQGEWKKTSVVADEVKLDISVTATMQPIL